MKYAIMQMPLSLWHKENILFTESSTANAIDYCFVYRGETENGPKNDVLEKLFDEFNVNHPQNYAGRSLSSGDVIMLEEGDTQTFHLVLSWGWKELNNFL